MEFETIKGIVETGSIGICLAWVWTLRKEVGEMKALLSKKEDDHKTDLREHNASIQGIFTNVVGENMSLLKVMEQVIREFKESNK